jgi:hypothetical protein
MGAGLAVAAGLATSQPESAKAAEREVAIKQFHLERLNASAEQMVGIRDFYNRKLIVGSLESYFSLVFRENSTLPFIGEPFISPMNHNTVAILGAENATGGIRIKTGISGDIGKTYQTTEAILPTRLSDSSYNDAWVSNATFSSDGAFVFLQAEHETRGSSDSVGAVLDVSQNTIRALSSDIFPLYKKPTMPRPQSDGKYAFYRTQTFFGSQFGEFGIEDRIQKLTN